jgi:hypothetical protein
MGKLSSTPNFIKFTRCFVLQMWDLGNKEAQLVHSSGLTWHHFQVVDLKHSFIFMLLNAIVTHLLHPHEFEHLLLLLNHKKTSYKQLDLSFSIFAQYPYALGYKFWEKFGLLLSREGFSRSSNCVALDFFFSSIMQIINRQSSWANWKFLLKSKNKRKRLAQQCWCLPYPWRNYKLLLLLKVQ